MSQHLFRWVRLGVNFIDKPGIRHRWIQRGKNPEVAKSLEQKMAEWNHKDPALHFKVDIGYKYVGPNRKDVMKERLQIRKQTKSSLQMEKAARFRKLSVPLEEVYQEWLKNSAPFHVQNIAGYFNIFDDLFGDAYFTPLTMLDIQYPQNEDVMAPVYHGNMLKPAETTAKPSVKFNGAADALYTLVLTTPDGHLTQEKGEYLHWLVGNIPANDISQGVEVCDYIQPFPMRGVGWCRYIFVLYRQDKVLDFSKYKRPENCRNLTARTFSTYDFYRDLQDEITPCGLAFFQSIWDSSLTDFFHDVLAMKEPIFEYDFDPVSLPPQEWFPKHEPFNLYLDKYKDTKTLGKELLLEKLKETHPFQRPEPPPKYPNAFPLPTSNPSWLNDDIRRRRRRAGKWKYM